MTLNDENKKIFEWNNDQLEHIRTVQSLIAGFTNIMVKNGIRHDKTKFGRTEQYWGFQKITDQLKKTKDGSDEEYKKSLLSEAVQDHYKHEEHHPEYWPNEDMPLTFAIEMYFDWMARTIQNGKNFDDFWDYNVSKLKDKPLALAIANALRKEFPQGVCENLIQRNG